MRCSKVAAYSITWSAMGSGLPGAILSSGGYDFTSGEQSDGRKARSRPFVDWP
jgi:hypothetical protein